MDNEYSDQEKEFENAVSAHKRGDLNVAEHLYNNILTSSPAHVNALHMLGVIAHQKGRHKESIELINKAIKFGINGAAVHANLATVYTSNNQPDEAINELNKAIEINPRMALAYNNLGNAYRKKSMDTVAIEAFKKAISIDPSFADAYANMGAVFLKINNISEAQENFQEAVKCNPNHASAAHMLASLTGKVSGNAPPEYSKQLFDEYSSNFDDHLVRRLGYSMPEMIRMELITLSGNNMHFNRLLDLGCGTGLVGLSLKPYTNDLTGVDVSGRMLEIARARNIYSALHCTEIQLFLNYSSDTFDLCTCADVFPYIGDVHLLIRAVRNYLKDSAYFVFSTELAAGSGYVLRKTGRYAHSRDYINKLAEDTDFRVVRMRAKNLRKQGGSWIPGDLFVLKAI